MFGRASGVWSASLWNNTIEPFLTLLVTLLQMLSGVALSFQSRESPLDTKVKSFLSHFNIFNYIIFLLKNQYNTPQPITRQNKTKQHKAVQQQPTTILYRTKQDNPLHHSVIQWKSIKNNTGKLQSYAVA